jgi:hypothetical protein
VISEIISTETLDDDHYVIRIKGTEETKVLSQLINLVLMLSYGRDKVYRQHMEVKKEADFDSEQGYWVGSTRFYCPKELG